MPIRPKYLYYLNSTNIKNVVVFTFCEGPMLIIMRWFLLSHTICLQKVMLFTLREEEPEDCVS